MNVPQKGEKAQFNFFFINYNQIDSVPKTGFFRTIWVIHNCVYLMDKLLQMLNNHYFARIKKKKWKFFRCVLARVLYICARNLNTL